jgi:hypothetical protein
MKLRQTHEQHSTKGVIDLATAIGLASLIIQCAQFALELRRQGKRAGKEQLRRMMDDATEGAGGLAEERKNMIIDRVADAVSSAEG